MSENNKVLYLPNDDYVQSANTLFHFMKEKEYLDTILRNRAVIPRYCVETIDYLNIHNGSHSFDEIAILQKCFCDIPFHKLADSFAVNGVGKEYESLSGKQRDALEKNNTHFDYYGQFAIAFSKKWGEQKRLQPIHYLNKESQYVKDFSTVFESVFSNDNILNEYAQDVINRIAYMKPLRGKMKRRIFENGTGYVDVDIYKNFHDEREWRYVPSIDVLAELNMECIIANPYVIPLCNEINERLEAQTYRKLWLDFSYDDIRYIIVPDAHSRISVIETIMNISDDCFDNKDDILMQKYILISKILVLAEVRKDW